MMNNYKIGFWTFIGLTVGALFFHFTGIARIPFLKKETVLTKASDDCPKLNLEQAFDSILKTRFIKVNGEVELFGERVPLEDPEVKERLIRELLVNTYWQSNTLIHFQYANRYFPEVEQVLNLENVPEDFKYLCLAESGFRDMVSPASAIGYWQFLKETGKRFGLEIRDDVDERYHLGKSTRAACLYFKEARERLGSWTNAAASFNMGVQGFSDRMKDQKQSSYYDLFLNQETSRYIFRILALKIIFAHPQKAGYSVTEEDLFSPYQYAEVQIDSSINNLADFSSQFGISYKKLKLLNPWLRSARLLNPERKTYTIRIMQN